jgi:hypothetical protein
LSAYLLKTNLPEAPYASVHMLGRGKYNDRFPKLARLVHLCHHQGLMPGVETFGFQLYSCWLNAILY